MKKLLTIISLTAAASMAGGHAQLIWNPDNFTEGTDYLVAGWNFNDDTSLATQLAVSHGTGTMTTNWISANVKDFGGTTTNSYSSDAAGRDIALQAGGTDGNPANDGNWIQFQFDLTNLEGLVMTYAAQATQSAGSYHGLLDNTWSYSLNGVDFIDFTTVQHVVNMDVGTVTVDFSSVTALTNQSSVFIRNTMTTQVGQDPVTASGNNRFDNFQFQASAVPEPGTWALIGIGSMLMLWRSRRRLA